MKFSYPVLVVGAILVALTAGTRVAYSASRGGDVTPDMTCNPETNPDCDGGGGGGSGGLPLCSISCSTGTVVGITTSCDNEACAYNPTLRQYYWGGTRFTYRQASGSNCQTSNLTCWDGLACGNCF